MKKRAIKKIRDSRTKIHSQLIKTHELHRMQLAAISTAALSNTDTSTKTRIGSDNVYWTPTYGDVCRAVDREMLYRNENVKLRRILSAYVKIKDHDKIIDLTEI